VVHFQIAERGAVLDAPVDQPLRAVEQPVVVQPHERLAHGARGKPRHGEALALPIQRGAQRAVLLGDAVARLLLPLPDPLEKLLTPQVMPRFSFVLLQLALDHHLGGDAGVIDARHPTDVEPAHPLPAREDVLDGGGQGMTEVQRTSDVGGGSTIENGGLSLTSSARKNPCSSHHRAQCGSTLAGSYPLSRSFSTRRSLIARG